MLSVLTSPLFASTNIAPARALALILAGGLFVLTLALGVLMWTRWGQARPLAKCAGLSMFAHLLLLCYCYGTRVLFEAPGRPNGDGTISVRIEDVTDDEEAGPITDSQTRELPDAVTTVEPETENPLRTMPDPAPTPPVGTKPAESPLRPAPTPLVKAPEPAPRVQSPPIAQAKPVSPPPLLDEPAAVEPQISPSTPTKPPAAQTDSPLVSDPPPEPTPAPPPQPESAPPVPVQTIPVAIAPAIPRRLGDGREMPALLRSRVSDRLKIAQRFGGTASSEAAVKAALDWLADNQSPDGRWDADAHGAGREARIHGHDRGGAGKKADTGVTGLALLAFLGSGESHWDGKHQETIQHGLEFLLASQAENGSLAGDAELFASMYCHGIATLAISEAYALTGDERLKDGVTRAIGYSIRSQHTGGGWRYQPGDSGDMSQFGWQVMSLKSAELADIAIPAETKRRAANFLRSCSSGNSRGLGSYRPGDRVSRTMTAEALACRIFLGAENSDAAQQEAADFLMEELPSRDSVNLYYWYYGTVALFQRQGSDWDRWNAAMQRELLDRQRHDGRMVGSWDPDNLWGNYGGRVYSTAMGTLCLEIYYRYLPLYGGDDPENPTRLTEAPESPSLPR